MSHRKPTMPASMKAPRLKGHCRWCDKPIVNPKGVPLARTWHPACVEIYKVAMFSDSQRAAVLDRDHGVCARCGRNAEQMRLRASWTRVEERWNPDWRSYGSRPRDMRPMRARWDRFKVRLFAALENRKTRMIGQGWRIYDRNAGAWWQADHIMPLIESDGRMEYFLLSNLVTLCTQCHNAKTASESADRAAKRKAKKI